MSSPKLNLPMLSPYLLGEVMSTHDGVSCYPAIRRGTEEKYIVKVISIPASQAKLDALLLTGAMASKEAALDYFMSLSQDVLNQTDILRQLSQQEGFIPYLDGQIVPMETDIGYEVYLLGTYRHSLARILRSDVLTHAEAANLGLDLCAALAACRRTGYLYADLKPSNIFRDSEQGFRIGDVGFIALSSLKYASLPDKYRSSYSAPELLDDFAVLNSTVDIYALGLVLYQTYNGGVLPFEGSAPNEILPPPIYADYEMSEIILKACHPDPKERWQEPTKMAQALIEYLQTYGAPETPIIPPVLDKPEEEEAEEEEPFLPEADPEQLQQEIDDLENADPDELAFLSGLVNDETAPSEENTADMPDAVMSEELSEIFAQADELIEHELPAPPVAPDPVFAPMPEPILLDEPSEESEEEPDNEDSCEASEEQTNTEAVESDNAQMLTEEAEAAVDSTEPPASLPEPESVDPESIPLEEKPLLRRLIAASIVILLLLGAWFLGQRYYNDYYLLQVDGIVLNCQKDTVTVQVLSDVDDQLLSVICTDSYGNSTTSAVIGGFATFTDLNPNTRYTVRVEALGKHKLANTVTDSFSTPAETQILSFIAGIGPEDRSVALNFTVNGPVTGNWTVRYSAEGIPERSMDFTGTNVIVSDLVAGALYTFTLTSPDGLYMAGQTQTQFLATNILYAKDLTITACGGGQLTAQWAQSEDGTVTEWRVRCFNEAGYNVTVTTTDLSYTFTDLDHTTPCTVEVTAVGMNRSVSTSISGNPVTVENVTCTFGQNMTILVSWQYSAQNPVEGWVLRYRIHEDTQIAIALTDASVDLLAIPGASYSFTIETTDGSFVFNNSYEFVANEVILFSGYGINSDDLSQNLYSLPEGEDWTIQDFPADGSCTEFLPGQKAAFVITSGFRPEASENPVDIRFVLHDAQGKFIQTDSVSMIWDALWQKDICILPIPTLPEAEGEYILTVYFDGMFVFGQDLTILPPIVEDAPEGEEPAI